MSDPVLAILLAVFVGPAFILLLALVGLTFTPWYRDRFSLMLRKRLLVRIDHDALDAQAGVLLKVTRGALLGLTAGVVAGVLFSFLPSEVARPLPSPLLLAAGAYTLVYVGLLAAWPQSKRGGSPAPARLDD